jgi:hypothetical protein
MSEEVPREMTKEEKVTGGTGTDGEDSGWGVPTDVEV